LKHNPSPTAGSTSLQHAGGLYGALFAWPLSRVAQDVGAALVCLGVGFLGTLVFTGTPLAAVGRWLRSSFVSEPEDQDEDEEEDDEEEVEEERPRGRGVVRTEEDPAPEVPAMEPEPEHEPIPAPRLRSSRSGGYKLPPLDLLRQAPESTADGRD